MKLHVYTKQGGHLEFENIEDFVFDGEDHTLTLLGPNDTIACVPRENILFLTEEYDGPGPNDIN